MSPTIHAQSPDGKLIICKLRLEHLLVQIKKIDGDKQLSVSDKISKIKIIKDEINKIGQEIDMIKKEINLTKSYNIN